MIIVHCIDVSSSGRYIVLGGESKSKTDRGTSEGKAIALVFDISQKPPQEACKPKVFDHVKGGLHQVKFLETSREGDLKYVATDHSSSLVVVGIKAGFQSVEQRAKVHSARISCLLLNGLEVFTGSLDKTLSKTKTKVGVASKALLHN